MRNAQTFRHARLGLLLGAAFVGPLVFGQSGPSTSKISGPDLAGFRTVENAIRARPSSAPARKAGQTGFLGIVTAEQKGSLVITDVDADSAADKAGVAAGDLLAGIAGKKPKSPDELREILQGMAPGESVKLRLVRAGKNVEATATLGSTSHPRSLNEERAYMGATLGDPADDGFPIRRVTAGSPAEKAGLKTGDVVVKIEGAAVGDPGRLDSLLNEKKPGDSVTLTLKKDGKESDVKVGLGEDPATASRGQQQQTFNPRNMWKKDVYRIAVVRIDYLDVKHNEKIAAKDWEFEMFSTDEAKSKQNATGQTLSGSMNDFYRELSVGAFHVAGKVFEPVLVSKNRMDYSPGNGTGLPARVRNELLTESLDKLLEREGAKALDDFDGIFYLFAGGRVQTSRGGLYWPHRASVGYKGKNWPYFIIQERGARMTDISVMCHEFGHMLGLPDLYARPENPGSEGLGIWCLMSNQAGNGRPQHMSAWCKEQLGWLKPALIDPTVKQKLILGPVNGSANECYKVLLRRDGSEYLLLENRRKTGFDASLPAEGLLIWHVVGNRPLLEESHGVEGPSGPRVFMSMVPYPSEANNSMTPFTTPSSKSELGGGLPVWITNIRQLPDGRITFSIGYEVE